MRLFLFALASVVLVSCQTADQQPILSAEEKTRATRDSANFTTIEWLDSTTKDLGKIKEGQVVEIHFRFRNSGDKNLIIANVSASCGCTIPEKPEKPIPPGAEDVIKAKFDSRGRKGPVTKDIYVEANVTPSTSIPLRFTGEVTE